MQIIIGEVGWPFNIFKLTNIGIWSTGYYFFTKSEYRTRDSFRKLNPIKRTYGYKSIVNIKS